jgi:GAF domain-containing protein
MRRLIWRTASRKGRDSIDDGHVDRLVAADAGAALDEFLDLVGDVRNHLHRLAEVVAATLLLEHALVDLARREVVGLPHAGGDEALVVSQVQVGLGAVIGHEHLAVLERRHRARIDVEVRIELDESDFEAPRFEDRRE